MVLNTKMVFPHKFLITIAIPFRSIPPKIQQQKIEAKRLKINQKATNKKATPKRKIINAITLENLTNKKHSTNLEEQRQSRVRITG